MRSITATMFLTLDGVVQAPGRADEDTREGFAHGGWGPAYHDEVMSAELAQDMARAGDMLLGRSTWQDLHTGWGEATEGDPFTGHLTQATKYVVSRTLMDADAWENSRLLRGEAVDTVSALKAEDGPDLSIVGSVALVQSLHRAALIERYTLLIHPLTLGSGTRLFEGISPLTTFELTGSVTTPRGVIIARYTRR